VIEPTNKIAERALPPAVIARKVSQCFNHLESAGIPKQAIVLGFHLPEVRPYTEFAAA
jgi:hypothetical protein